MDVPKLVLFLHEKKYTPTQEILLKKLFELGYSPMVDALHTTSYNWFVKNVKPCSHKLFSLDEEDVLFYDVEELDTEMIFVPHFLIYFNEGHEMSITNWICIKEWMEYILFDTMETDSVLRGKELMIKPYVEKSQEIGDVVLQRTGNEYYSFTKEYLEKDDIMLYQVEKPFTDLPYTSVLRQFSLKGPRPFFTSLYVCSSWGVSRYDLLFLKDLWIHEFKLAEDEFDMDAMLKASTEACYPQPGMIPELEPEVYRRDINHVKNVLQEKKEGRLCNSHTISEAKKEKIQQAMSDAFVTQ